MMRLLRGEITGLNIEPIVVKTLFFVLFPLFIAYSQIPINGFCRFNAYNVEPGCDGMFATNFNNDSYTDILLYNSQKKKLYSYAGEQNGNFTLKKINNIPFEVSGIRRITNKINNTAGLIVISEKSRRFASARTNAGGAISFSEVKKLSSYPDNASFADADNDGHEEALISGPAFQGLSLFIQSAKGFVEKKIDEKNCFSQSVFCDINSDGYSDIAAFNLLNKQLVFYYNDSRGNFRPVRNIQFDKRISQLQSINLDLDAYQDLAYASDNSINILFGDNISSFSSTLKINTRYKPDKFIFGDFNKDGKLDIAYISCRDSILSIIYAKGPREFYPEIVCFQKEGIVTILPYYSKFIDGLAALSKSGKLYTITKMTTVFDDVQIAMGLKPALVNYFDRNNNGIWSLCFVDKKLQNLNIITRNNAGMPSLFYTVKLYNVPEKIEIDNSDKSVKTFFCYSYNKRLLQIIRVDFARGRSDRSCMYMPGGIKDLKIKRGAGTKAADIYALYNKNNKLCFSQYEFRDYRYVEANSMELVARAYSANLSINKGVGCYAWHWEGNKIILSKIQISPAGQTENIFKEESSSLHGIYSILGDVMNEDKDFNISFLYGRSGNTVLVNSDKQSLVIKQSELPGVVSSGEIKKSFAGEGRFNKLKKVFICPGEKGEVYVLDFLKKGKNLIFTKLTDAPNIGDFFIKNMSGKDFHIVYSDEFENTIKIKKI